MFKTQRVGQQLDITPRPKAHVSLKNERDCIIQHNRLYNPNELARELPHLPWFTPMKNCHHHSDVVHCSAADCERTLMSDPLFSPLCTTQQDKNKKNNSFYCHNSFS